MTKIKKNLINIQTSSTLAINETSEKLNLLIKNSSKTLTMGENASKYILYFHLLQYL